MNIKSFLKANVVAIAALIGTAVTSAFTLSMDDYDTYAFTGTQFDKNAVQDPNNWLLNGSSSAINCGESLEDVTCTMVIPKGYNDTNGHPKSAEVTITANTPATPGDPTTLQSVVRTSDSQPLLQSQIRGEAPEEE